MTTTALRIEDIPAIQELIREHKWVNHDDVKTPLNPHNGYNAKWKNPKTLASFAKVRYNVGRTITRSDGSSVTFTGFGRVLTKEGITLLDVDDCIDDQGNLTPWGRYLVELFKTYTEISLGCHGLHFILKGSLPQNINVNKEADTADGENRLIEAYDCDRYITVTGNQLLGTPDTIEERQGELDIFYQEVRSRRDAYEAQKREQKQKQRTTRKQQTTPGTDSPYGLKALEEECDNVAFAQEGNRNHQLNTSAFALGQLVGGGALSRSTVERNLFFAAQRSGLPENEIEKTLRSGIEAGIAVPRTLPAKEMPTYQAEPEAASNGNGSNNGNVYSTAGILCSFDADDAGNSDAMNFLYGQDFLYCPSLGWLHHNKTHWILDMEGAKVKTCAIATLRKRRIAAAAMDKDAIIKCTKADERRVNACVNLFKTHVNTSIDSFDCDPDKLNCRNGVLDLRTGEMEEHSRLQRFTYCLPVEYGQADMTEWLDYLNGVIGGGQVVIDYLQTALGYSLTGHTREEILFYLFGPSRSGKGTMAETFMALLPRPLSTMVDFNSFTAKRDGDVSNFDLAPLKPSRLIFASESNRSQSLNPAKIKQLTGGDHITACFKHKDFFSYRPQFKVWMMSNHPVNGDPEDDALWGRVRVIEFPNSFLGMEDKSKKTRLKQPDVLKGVLYWAVQGAIKWYALGAKGLSTPEVIAKTTQKQRAELDYVQQWLDEAANIEDEATGELWTPNEIVSASYNTWCESNHIQYVKGSKALAQSLKAKGFRVSEPQYIPAVKKMKRGVGGLHIASA